jgi:hypothetical protein
LDVKAVAVAALPVHDALLPVTEIPQLPVAPVPVVSTNVQFSFFAGKYTTLFAVNALLALLNS